MQISINKLPAGASVPFIHSHKNNEEIYGIIAGKGKAVIDEKEIHLECYAKNNNAEQDLL